MDNFQKYDKGIALFLKNTKRNKVIRRWFFGYTLIRSAIKRTL